MPGADKTLNEQIRDVASMKSFSLVIFSEDRGTSRLEQRLRKFYKNFFLANLPVISKFHIAKFVVS